MLFPVRFPNYLLNTFLFSQPRTGDREGDISCSRASHLRVKPSQVRLSVKFEKKIFEGHLLFPSEYCTVLEVSNYLGFPDPHSLKKSLTN